MSGHCSSARPSVSPLSGYSEPRRSSASFTCVERQLSDNPSFSIIYQYVLESMLTTEPAYLVGVGT